MKPLLFVLLGAVFADAIYWRAVGARVQKRPVWIEVATALIMYAVIVGLVVSL